MITIYLYEKPPDQILTLFARLSSSPFLKKVAPKIPILILIPRCFRGFAPTTTVPPSFMGQRSVGSALHKPFTSVFLRVGNDGGIFGCLSTCSEIAFVETTTKNICTYLHNRDVDCWCEIIVFVRNMLQAKKHDSMQTGAYDAKLASPRHQIFNISLARCWEVHLVDTLHDLCIGREPVPRNSQFWGPSILTVIILDARIEEITLINFDPIFYLKWPRKVCPKPFQIEDRFREQSP